MMPAHAGSGARPPRTLVTGGAGFLGSHLCDRFIVEGHEVVCLDNLLTGRIANIEHLLENPRFAFLQCDISAPIARTADLLVRFQNEKPGQNSRGFDYVLHFASPASPKDYLRHPIETLEVGSIGTQNALEIAKAFGSVFLLASTSEVYGDPQVNPQSESYWGRVNPIGLRSVYDEAKRFAEAITMAYYREFGVRVRVARIFNTYGERMRVNDGRVLPNFLMQALQGKPLTIYGDGTQTRSLCYVSDLIDGLFRLLMSDEIGPINIGNPDEVSIAQLALEVIELTQSRSTLTCEPLPVDDPCRRRPDISKATLLLNWHPQVSRLEGIQRVIPYFRTELQSPAQSKAPVNPPEQAVAS